MVGLYGTAYRPCGSGGWHGTVMRTNLRSPGKVGKKGRTNQIKGERSKSTQKQQARAKSLRQGQRPTKSRSGHDTEHHHNKLGQTKAVREGREGKRGVSLATEPGRVGPKFSVCLSGRKNSKGPKGKSQGGKKLSSTAVRHRSECQGRKGGLNCSTQTSLESLIPSHYPGISNKKEGGSLSNKKIKGSGF